MDSVFVDMIQASYDHICTSFFCPHTLSDILVPTVIKSSTNIANVSSFDLVNIKLIAAFFPLDVFSDSFILFAYRSSDTAISNAWHKYEGQKLRIRKTPAYFCKGIVRFISC